MENSNTNININNIIEQKFNETENTTSPDDNLKLHNEVHQMEPVHIALISVGSTILFFALVVVIYIIVKRKHNCSNKICSEESTEENEKEKSETYKKKDVPEKIIDNNPNKNNINLRVNVNKEKLRALEKFKKLRKQPPIRKRRDITKPPQPIIQRKVSAPAGPKYPPGMDAHIRKTISQPTIKTIPTTPKEEKEHTDDIV